MSDWFYKAAAGGAIRFFECLLSAGPTLLVGLLIAAVLRFYFGTSGTKRLFGGDSIRSLPQSWAVGMLLPVCSIGVLPILIEMRRSRIKPGAMSAFALSAPLFNPLSLLYGLTLSRPYVILMFAAGSLAVVTCVGILWDLLTTDQCTSTDDDSRLEIIGIRRLLAMGVYVGRQLCGPVGAWALVAAMGMWLLAAVLPWGALGHSVSRDDWWAPARMAAVAIPMYATPMMAMSQLGMMFQHANSPGAAFILLVVGAGLNLGTLVWLGKHFGIRRVVIWFAALMMIVVAIAYAINRPLIPPGVEPSDHTHAFDIYTNAVHHVGSAQNAIDKSVKQIGVVEKITLGFLGLIVLGGMVIRVCAIDHQEWNSKQPDKKPRLDRISAMDRNVSPQIVGGTLLAGLVALSIVMCYAYYPSTEECLEEIRYVRADVLSAARSGDHEHAKFWIPHWDQWTRRLEVGTLLRRGQVTPYQRTQGYLVRKKLEVLKHELEHDHVDKQAMGALLADITNTNTRWSRAFRQPGGRVERESKSVSIIDTKIDSSHDHRHSHDDHQSHEHQHEEHFSGTHDHEHDHGHRHDRAPHGGQIVNLDHSQHRPGTESLHLEVMPPEGRIFKAYLLDEELGVIRSREPDNGFGNLLFRIQSGGLSDKTEIAMRQGDDDAAFTGQMPTDIAISDVKNIVAQYTVDGREFQSTFSISSSE